MPNFNDYVIDQGAVLEQNRVGSFGDGAAEFSSFSSAAAVIPLLATTVLKVTGADRLEFVHGQVSNEVKRLQVGEFRDALLLNYKGHALAQLRVLRLEDTLLLVVEGGAGDFVKEQLDAHIIFDQVELKRLDDVTLTVQGVTSKQVLEAALSAAIPGEKSFAELVFEGGRVLVSPSKRSLQGGFDLTVAAEAAISLFEGLIEAGATVAGEKALNIARVSAGIPNAEGEGGEGVLPQEAGLERLVSYTKGCYLGQEIMARIEARGNLRRSLQGLKLDGLPEPGGRTLTAEGKTVGRLGTVVEHTDLGVIALAVLRNDLSPDASLLVGGKRAEPVPLPFAMS